MARKYIDADLLRKEVEKQIDYAKGVYPKGSMEEARATAITAVCLDILTFIDSLRQEQSCDTCTNDKGCVTCKDGELWEGKEQPSEDLEAEIDAWYSTMGIPVSPDALKDTARHFANWQKEQMLKNAEECDLYWDGDFLAIDLNMRVLGYSERDKVKIVIVKEDKK